MPRGYLNENQNYSFVPFLILARQGLEIDLTAESDAALLQQRRLVDKLPREELEDRWSFSISLTLDILREDTHLYTGGTYTFIQGRGH